MIAYIFICLSLCSIILIHINSKIIGYNLKKLFFFFNFYVCNETLVLSEIKSLFCLRRRGLLDLVNVALIFLL